MMVTEVYYFGLKGDEKLNESLENKSKKERKTKGLGTKTEWLLKDFRAGQGKE